MWWERLISHARWAQCSPTARNGPGSQCSASSSSTSQAWREIWKWLGLENHWEHLLPSLIIKLHEGWQVPPDVQFSLQCGFLAFIAGCPLDPLLCQFSHDCGRSRFEGMVDVRCIYTTLGTSPGISQCWITAFAASSSEKSWHHCGVTRQQQWASPASCPETLAFRRTWKRCKIPRLHTRSSPSFIDLPHHVKGAKWPQHEPGFIFWR